MNCKAVSVLGFVEGKLKATWVVEGCPVEDEEELDACDEEEEEEKWDGSRWSARVVSEDLAVEVGEWEVGEGCDASPLVIGIGRALTGPF